MQISIPDQLVRFEMFLNLLRQVQEEALSREIAKRKLPNEVRDKNGF